VTDVEQLGGWLRRYIDAWRSNDPDRIRPLFSEDAVYRWHPWEGGAEGVDAIVAAWLEEPDDPAAWEMSCEPLAVNGDLGIGRCRTRYFATADEPERIYHNIFLARLAADGRCSDFTEYYMKEPGRPAEG
jgi:hypothetical protein